MEGSHDEHYSSHRESKLAFFNFDILKRELWQSIHFVASILHYYDVLLDPT